MSFSSINNANAFFVDFINEKSASFLIKKLFKDTRGVLFYGIAYSGMSDGYKAVERRNWNKIKDLSGLFLVHAFEFCVRIPFSLPMRSIPLYVGCKIDGYDFVPLKSLKEYHKAGDELNNCLQDWSSDNNPVVVVKKYNKTLAAIEIDGKTIVQARIKNNDSIDMLPDLKKATIKFFMKNGFEYRDALK